MMARRKKSNEVVEPAATPEVVPAPAEPEPEPKIFRIAEGRHITSLRGILSEGEEARPEFFAGGSETFEQLRKAGAIK